MNDYGSYLPTVRIRNVDLDPDLIFIETTVQSGQWRGVATAYTSTPALCTSATDLAAWSRRPEGVFKVETTIRAIYYGSLLLSFVPADGIGHIECKVQIATAREDDPMDKSWKLSLAIRTEPGLVERFGRQLLALTRGTLDEVVLEGLVN